MNRGALKRRELSRRAGLAAVAMAALGLITGCNKRSERRTLDVYAASSLTEAFQELERAFEAEHDDIDVALTFAGSQILRVQIEQGAAADVFASANPRHLQALVDAGTVVDSQVFAHNELVVIVPLDNPAGIDDFSDLPRAERIVLGTKDVPVGSYARQALKRADDRLDDDFEAAVLSHVVSEETNVRLVRVKVELGEADAAIVYRTDAVSSSRVRTIPIPHDINVRASYTIGIVKRTDDRALAEQWVEHVTSKAGEATLERHGFAVGQ